MTKYHQCKECGSNNVDVKAWYNLKEERPIQDGDYTGPGWCRDCEEDTKVIFCRPLLSESGIPTMRKEENR